jgi:Zn-dependent protease with chaperone function
MSASVETAGWPVRISDGGTAQRAATCFIGADGLTLVFDDETRLSFAYTGMSIVSEPAHGVRGILIPDQNTRHRIAFDDRALSSALKVQPGFGFARRQRSYAAFGKLAGWIAGAAASLTVVVFLLIPVFADWIARTVPAAFERDFGARIASTIATQLAEKNEPDICVGTAGRRALEGVITEFADRAGVPHPIRLWIVPANVENAFALPGGQVVIFSGLIDFADTADELAGVLAHEIAHVEHRDPVRSMTRSVAIGAVAGFVFGDPIFFSTLGGLASLALGITYSREVEEAADRRAHAIMTAAGIDPRALGRFFIKLDAKEAKIGGGLLAHLSTHPESAARAQWAAAADRPSQPRPSMTEAEWRSLKASCGANPSVRR